MAPYRHCPPRPMQLAFFAAPNTGIALATNTTAIKAAAVNNKMIRLMSKASFRKGVTRQPRLLFER